MLTAARNLLGWWKGQIAAEELVWTTATDVAGKGLLSLIGGFAGASIGLLLLGPAGAVIMGPAGGIFGAGMWARTKSWSGKHIDKKAESSLERASESLAGQCLTVLDEKANTIAKKQSLVGDGLAGSYASQRLDDDVQFIAERRCDLQAVVNDTGLKASRLRDRVLAAVIRSNVYPSRIQVELQELNKAFRRLEQAPATKAREAAEKTGRGLKQIFGDVKKGVKDAIEALKSEVEEEKRED